MKYLLKSQELMEKYSFVISKIISNSDNTMDDVKNEAYIVTKLHYDEILEDNKIFINELKKCCLKFNKYSRRIDTIDKWKEFNDLESNMLSQKEQCNNMNIDDDKLCKLITIQTLISDEDYNFLLCYFGYGLEYTSKKYNITESNTRVKVHRLINFLRGNMG